MTGKKPTKKDAAKAASDPRRDARLGWNSGGWIDESFPEEKVAGVIQEFAQGLDLAQFCRWFGGAIGRYRMMQDSADTTPSTSEELAHIEKLLVDIESVSDRITNLPPHTDAEVSLACWKAYRDTYDALPNRIAADLIKVRTLLWAAERALEPHLGKRGRKAASNRDALLTRTAEKLLELGLTGKGNAKECARQILLACGIYAPEGARVRPERRGKN